MKYYYSDAYRRVAHLLLVAAQPVDHNFRRSCVHSSTMLRLTFWGSPNLPNWCSFSETVTDLSNEIPFCNKWDHKPLRSPAQPETRSPTILPDDVQIARAMSSAVHVPTKITARSDGFIDDVIWVFLDTPWNREKEPHTVPLAIHVTSRPHAGETEAVKRREIVTQPNSWKRVGQQKPRSSLDGH